VKDLTGSSSAKGDEGFLIRSVRSANQHWTPACLGNANGCFGDVSRLDPTHGSQ
jgi:hypothetical protein